MSFAKAIKPWLLALLAVAMTTASAIAQQPQKPDILVIMADDIGYWNISAYNRGMMGYHTPNIDRIVNEGAIFTDYCGQQSCTAGRVAFITGQSPLRTGLLKVGLPGEHIQSFKEFQPRQRPGSFSVDQALEKLRLLPSSN
jgi:arylsulfatase A-like enzyme